MPRLEAEWAGGIDWGTGPDRTVQMTVARKWERVGEYATYEEARREERSLLVTWARAERRRELGEELSCGDREVLRLQGTRVKRCGRDRSRFVTKAWFGEFRTISVTQASA